MTKAARIDGGLSPRASAKIENGELSQESMRSGLLAKALAVSCRLAERSARGHRLLRHRDGDGLRDALETAVVGVNSRRWVAKATDACIGSGFKKKLLTTILTRPAVGS